jgi:hypothetical protein
MLRSGSILRGSLVLTPHPASPARGDEEEVLVASGFVQEVLCKRLWL